MGPTGPARRAEGIAATSNRSATSTPGHRVGGYAAAVFEDLPSDRLEEVEDELFRFARTVESTPALRDVLVDRDRPLAVRQGVADQLLTGKVHPATLRLVDYAVAGGRPRTWWAPSSGWSSRPPRARGWRVARVRAAHEIDEHERRGWPSRWPPRRAPGRAAGDDGPVAAGRGDRAGRGPAGRRHAPGAGSSELREHMSAAGWQEPAVLADADEPTTEQREHS